MTTKAELLGGDGWQYLARTSSKADPVPLSLTVSGDNDIVAVLDELASDTTAHVDGSRAAPRQLQHRPKRVVRLLRTEYDEWNK